VAKLAELGVRVHCLALGGVELTSSTGKLTMNVINAVAEFERERWRGLRTAARTVGPVLGRSPRQNARGRRHRRCCLGAAPNLNSLNQGAAPMLSSGGSANAVVALPRQQHEASEVAKAID
jgi:putative DNA-invertase from lambdoid prophage Rac